MQSLLAGLWVKACEKAGLIAVNDEKLVDAFMQHGVDVKEDVDCGDYLAKQDDSRRWGFAEELSKATSKAGRAKGVHPHHFLVRLRLLVIESVTSVCAGHEGASTAFLV